MEAKKVRTPTIHQTEMVLNRDRLKKILNGKNMEYIDLYHEIVEKFGLDLSYKGFMSIVAGKATWKLLYAFAVTDVLDVEIKDIFELVQVDTEELKAQKEQGKVRYQTN